MVIFVVGIVVLISLARMAAQRRRAEWARRFRALSEAELRSLRTRNGRRIALLATTGLIGMPLLFALGVMVLGSGTVSDYWIGAYVATIGAMVMHAVFVVYKRIEIERALRDLRA